jgi:hypothetical protein
VRDEAVGEERIAAANNLRRRRRGRREGGRPTGPPSRGRIQAASPSFGRAERN